MKDSATYEHIPPESVGNQRRVLVSELSGKSNLVYKAREMGMAIDEADLRGPLRLVKQLENEGYEFEAAEASLRVLLETAIHGELEFFKVESFRVVSDMHRDGALTTEATVKVRVGDRVVHTVAEGDGPVHALDRALHRALHQFFEPLRTVQLTDYKVRVLDAREGTAAKVRVLVQQTDGTDSWTTVGVSENIIEASYKALADGVRYKLLRDRVAVPSAATAAGQSSAASPVSSLSRALSQ